MVVFTAFMLGIASPSVAGAAQRGGVELVPVGQARDVGPLRIEVASAVATVQPHTYRLTMTVDNKTKRTVHGPHVDLNCKGDSAPHPFGLTGFLVPTASKMHAVPRATEYSCSIRRASARVLRSASTPGRSSRAV